MLDARNLILSHCDNQNEVMINNKVAKITLARTLSQLHPTFNIDLLRYFVPNPLRTYRRQYLRYSMETGNELHIVEALNQQRVFNEQPE